MAYAILCRLPQNPTTDANANSQPKYFDLNKLTQAVHELHIIEPQHERSSDENANLLVYLTALTSADIKKKGKERQYLTLVENMYASIQAHPAPYGKF
jgi:hypothetical protein